MNTNKLYNDIITRELDINDLVLQDHVGVKDFRPSISFEINSNNEIIALGSVMKNEEEFCAFIKEFLDDGYLIAVL